MLSDAVLSRLRERVVLRSGSPRSTAAKARLIDAALIVLADGRPRSAIEIAEEAVRQTLLPDSINKKTFYNSLQQYLQRRVAEGKRPLFVQDLDRRFRINHTPDDWPAPKTPLAAARKIVDVDRYAKTLKKAGRGDDPDAFEVAVCDAFEALGFVAKHIGGHHAPDGYIDAPLGQAGYRAMLECKTVRAGEVRFPYAAEAAQYKDKFAADYCTLIAPSFGGDALLDRELQKHNVSAWETADIVALLEAGSHPWEMRPLFAGGFVAGRVSDLLWEREHGRAKRIAVICDILLEMSGAAQSSALGRPADSPLLNEDSAMMTVDAALAAHDAHIPCVREDVRAAFVHLCDPLVGRAAYVEGGQAIVVFAGSG